MWGGYIMCNMDRAGVVLNKGVWCGGLHNV